VLLPLYDRLQRIAEKELGAWLDRIQQITVSSGVVVKLRFWLVSGDFLDAYASESGRFAFHFEGRFTDRGIYRHDNAPHGNVRPCPTYPKHCHAGSEHNIVPSNLPDDAAEAFGLYCKLLIAYLGELNQP
jgi:hypothetical protein